MALLKSVVDGAVEHTVDPADEDGLAATYIEEFGDTGLTLAGPGAPCVSEFDTYELAPRRPRLRRSFGCARLDGGR